MEYIDGLAQHCGISCASPLALPQSCTRPLIHMMTSSNGNIFRVTSHLCGEFTGPHVMTMRKHSSSLGISSLPKQTSIMSRGYIGKCETTTSAEQSVLFVANQIAITRCPFSRRITRELDNLETMPKLKHL